MPSSEASPSGPQEDTPAPPSATGGISAPTGGCGATWIALRDVLVRESLDLNSPEIMRLPQGILCTQVMPWEDFPVDGTDGAKVVLMRILHHFESTGKNVDGYVTILANDGRREYSFMALNVTINAIQPSDSGRPSPWPLATTDGQFYFEIPPGCAGAQWLAVTDLGMRALSDDGGTEVQEMCIRAESHFGQTGPWTLDDCILVMPVRIEQLENIIEGCITIDLRILGQNIHEGKPLMALISEPGQAGREYQTPGGHHTLHK